MKKLLIASAALTLMCTPAFAAQHHKSTHHKSYSGSSTTGMSHGTHRGGMRPDASGQGGSGPGSDQGGTRAAPSDERHGY